MVITAVILTMLLGLVALVIDLGSMYLGQRQAQSAADAGSLAAAEDLPLPSNTTAAATDATNYGHTLNDSAASATSAAPVSSGCSNLSNLSYTSTSPAAWAACFQAQVNVSQTLALTFARLFGSTGSVSASAVASVNLTPSASAGNLMSNGNFPTGCSTSLLVQPDPTFCEPGYLEAAGSTIGTSGTPWTVWYGNVDWAAYSPATQAASRYVPSLYTGPPDDPTANVIDLNGNIDGGISQTVGGLIIGRSYLLSFSLSGNDGNYEPTFTGEVAIGSQLSATPPLQAGTPPFPTSVVPTAVCPTLTVTICVSLTHTDNPAGVMHWEQVGIPFTATSTSTTISFLSTSSQATVQYQNTGPTIADVNLQLATFSLTQ